MFLRNGLVLTVAGGGVAALNYLFHIVAARGLSVAGFAELSSDLGIIFIVLAGAMGLAAKSMQTGEVFTPLKRAVLLCVFLFCLGGFFSVKILIIGLISLGGYALAVRRGALQHEARYIPLAGHMLLEPFLKLGALFFVLQIGIDPLWSVLVGMVVVAWPVQAPRTKMTYGKAKEIWHFVWPFVGVTALWNIDLVAAQDPLYAPAARIGQVYFLVAHMLTTVVYSAPSTQRWRALVGVLGLGGLVAVTLSVFLGEWVVGLLFGGEYRGSAAFLPLYVAGSIFLAATNAVVHWALLRRVRVPFWPFLGGILGLILVQVFRPDVVFFAVQFCVFFALYTMCIRGVFLQK